MLNFNADSIHKQQYEFGPRSCFNREKEDIAIRIVMGVAVQLLCGYVTLPLYALVTQVKMYKFLKKLISFHLFVSIKFASYVSIASTLIFKSNLLKGLKINK